MTLVKLQISPISLLENATEKEISFANDIVKYDEANNWLEIDNIHQVLWNEINCTEEWSSVSINKRTLFSVTAILKANLEINNETS